VKVETTQDDKPESVKKWLDILGDGMYLSAFGPNKFAFSRSLLTLLGYDPEEFAVELTKYRKLIH
jgi:hypothetical protein